MSWKERMREIAERNPEAIPAWARSGGAVKVWDRAEWQVRDQPAMEPEVAARPILFVLRWLAPRGGLTQRGLSAIGEFAANPGAAVLDDSMTTPKGTKFLNAHYEECHSTDAINTLIDPSVELHSESLDARWSAFGKPDSEQDGGGQAATRSESK
jgi:hypothetical protein